MSRPDSARFPKAILSRHRDDFPSPRCASATKIVRPREFTVETQPQVQPALLRLSAIISQYFMRGGFCLFCKKDCFLLTFRSNATTTPPDASSGFTSADSFLLIRLPKTTGR